MKLNRVFNALFFTLLVFLGAATLFLPKRRFSKLEQRELSAFPKLSFEAVENGKVFLEGENWLSDHFVFRNSFISAKTKLCLLSGKNKINGVFVTDEFLAEDFEIKNQKTAEKNLEAINRFYQNNGQYNKMNLMIMPTAVELKKEELLLSDISADQIKYIKSLYEKTDGINCVDSYKTLQTGERGKCFYNTDGGLTSYGAYLEYVALSKALSFKAVSRDMFNVEHVSHDFLGDAYGRVLAKENLKDTVDLYHYSENSFEIKEVKKITANNSRSYSSVFFRDYLTETDKSKVFLGQPEPVITIKSNAKSYNSLLVFCDEKSYPLTQFLPLHYEEVTLVNLDLLDKPLENYLPLYRYNSILFLYDAETFQSNKNIAKVSEF